MKLNLGCGKNILEGWVNVDKAAQEGADIVTFPHGSIDLANDLATNGDVYIVDLDDECINLNFADDTFDEFLLSHIIEHIQKPLPLMQELHRIAKPGAICTIRTPYGASDDAWEDPTHVRPYFTHSFGYFGQPHYWRADYGYRGDWRVKLVTLVVDSPCDYLMIRMSRNIVKEMVAVLEAVKPIREAKKELQDVVNIEVRVEG